MKEKENAASWMLPLIRHRIVVLILIFLCTIGLSIPLSNMGIEMDNRPERFAPDGDDSFVQLSAMGPNS